MELVDSADSSFEAPWLWTRYIRYCRRPLAGRTRTCKGSPQMVRSRRCGRSTANFRKSPSGSQGSSEEPGDRPEEECSLDQLPVLGAGGAFTNTTLVTAGWQSSLAGPPGRQVVVCPTRASATGSGRR